MVDLYWKFFFFFKQKTAYEMRISDWSSDVCSSDLNACLRAAAVRLPRRRGRRRAGRRQQAGDDGDTLPAARREAARHRFGAEPAGRAPGGLGAPRA